jgi:uncharacterized membrane protein
MKTTRPASHWFAILFFSVIALACGTTGYLLLSRGEDGYAMQFAALALAIVALSGLGTQSKWAQIYCSVLLVLFPLFALSSLAVIVVRAKNVNYVSLLPLFIVSVLMLALFYQFAFGQASRDAFKRKPV